MSVDSPPASQVDLDPGFDLPFRVAAEPPAFPPPSTGSAQPAAPGLGDGVFVGAAPLLAGAPVAVAVAAAVSDEADTPILLFRAAGAGMTASSTPSSGTSITLDMESRYIPVNANNTSRSKWRKEAVVNPDTGATEYRDLVGLPLMRDFDLRPMRDLSGWDGQVAPPSGPPSSDPDLKRMTATVTNAPSPHYITVRVTYAAGSTGRIVLWKTPDKREPINWRPGETGSVATAMNGGVLHTFPSCDFYVEGLEPSSAEDDITLEVEYSYSSQPRPGQTTPTVVNAKAQKKLTVTPFVNQFEVKPKTDNGGLVQVFRDAFGRVTGFSSGYQAGDGQQLTKHGATFLASVNRKGVGGGAIFVNNVVGMENGQPSAVEVVRPGPAGPATYRYDVELRRGSPPGPVVRKSPPILDKVGGGLGWPSGRKPRPRITTGSSPRPPGPTPIPTTSRPWTAQTSGWARTTSSSSGWTTR